MVVTGDPTSFAPHPDRVLLHHLHYMNSWVVPGEKLNRLSEPTAHLTEGLDGSWPSCTLFLNPSEGQFEEGGSSRACECVNAQRVFIKTCVVVPVNVRSPPLYLILISVFGSLVPIEHLIK